MIKAESKSFDHSENSFSEIAHAVQTYLNRRFNEISNRGKVQSVHQTSMSIFNDGDHYGTLVTIVYEEE